MSLILMSLLHNVIGPQYASMLNRGLKLEDIIYDTKIATTQAECSKLPLPFVAIGEFENSEYVSFGYIKNELQRDLLFTGGRIIAIYL